MARKVTLEVTNEELGILSTALADFINAAIEAGLVDMKLEGEDLRDKVLNKQREVQEGIG